MLHRWTSSYFLEWTPILTFARRRLELLNWLEEHTSPVAFTETHKSVGVAMLANDLRVVASRGSMLIESGYSGAEIKALAPAIEGMFEVLAPKNVVLSRSQAMITYDLGDRDYHEECARVGSRFAFPLTDQPGFRPIDGSALVDLESPELNFQVEWGVVEATELLARLQRPQMGRLHAEQHQLGESRFDFDQLRDELPSVSLLVSVSAMRKTGGEVSDTTQVLDAVTAADVAAGRVAIALHKYYER